MKTIFITSTGRTGTDFFTTLFNEYVDNAWSMHEPRPAFRRRSHQLITRRPTLFEKHYFRLPRIKRHRKRAEEWYVETNYHLAAAIDFLREVFPEGSVVHVIRDGRSVVTSWLNKYRYITNNHLLPEHVEDRQAQELWDKWNPVQKLAWYWKTINLMAVSKHPDIWIRFEDIFSGDKEGVFKVLDHFEGLHYKHPQVEKLLERKVNKTQTPFFPTYDQWPDFWKEQFYEIAGDAMQKFGYSQ
ncbi:MAG: sulfotransferase [Bacteroidales bacterium]|nr:sulfotransferase [Bacteroidales bacterium]